MNKTCAVLVAVLGACGNGSGAPDASIDGALVDADLTPDTQAVPDALDLCPGRLTFTGDYVDWDSTETMFRGVSFATLTEVGNGSNTSMTAPNGRGSLCFPLSQDAEISFTHSDYLSLVYSMDADAAAAGPYSIKGLKPARATELFSNELSLTRDTADALVLVEVRSYPSMEPVIGATVSLGNTHDGAFTPDASRVYQSGATTTNDGYVVFANTQIAGGTTTVSVTPPGGTTCVGRAAISLVADQLAATTFACD